jgi:hypothetical protein
MLIAILFVTVFVVEALTAVDARIFPVTAGIVTVTLLAVSAGLSVTDPALGVLSFRDPLIVYSSVFF